MSLELDPAFAANGLLFVCVSVTDEGQWRDQVLLNGTYGRLRTARLGPDGSFYLTTSIGSGDRVIRLTPTPQ